MLTFIYQSTIVLELFTTHQHVCIALCLFKLLTRPVSYNFSVMCTYMQMFLSRNVEIQMRFLHAVAFMLASAGRNEPLELIQYFLLQLLGLPDMEEDTFEPYHADVEDEPETDHQQMGVSQQ